MFPFCESVWVIEKKDKESQRPSYNNLDIAILEITPLKMSLEIGSKPFLICFYAINAITGSFQ